jgi:hypothetical protein
MPVSLEQARAAKETAKTMLSSVPGLAGLGITRIGDDFALKVNLRQPLPAGVSVPERIADVPVCVEVVGTITKRS